MIAPMKKVSLVVMDRERDAALERLRSLGVVHLERRAVGSDTLSRLLEKKSRAETAIGILRNYAGAAPRAESSPAVPADALVDTVLGLMEKRKAEQEALTADLKELARIAPWGDFDPRELALLAASGMVLVPYELSLKSYADVGDTARLLVLRADRNLVRCLAVGAPLPAEAPFVLPLQSLSALQAAIEARRQKSAGIEQSLAQLAGQSTDLEAELTRVQEAIEFEIARCAMEVTADSPEGLAVSWLSGFVPAAEAGVLKRAAADSGWALIVDDPAEGDSPPTLVRNNPFVRLVQPVFSLLGTVPGYREYDISLSFLLFFTLFFAMIFGDAGYGALLLAMAVFFGLKSRIKQGKIPDGALLIGLLSAATVVWGAMTGTWFALPVDSLPGFMQALILPPFFPDPNLPPNEATKVVQQNIKHLCFIIGAGQLSLAHLKNIKKAFPSLTAIAQVGWLSMVIGLYFLVLNLVLDKTAFPVPGYALWMIVGGIATYFVFTEQKGGNFFKNIFKGLANFLPTFLSAVSSFSDIISYIRLFAVGLAGYAIAESFNGMAGALPSGLVRVSAGLLILVFGHGLNLAMSSLSVVVHGIRLNMLEYSGHLGMEWSGVGYAPFALKKKRDV